MRRLLFVYNADGGWVAGAFDLAHKLLSPSTYPCRLCDVTYGSFGMKRHWAEAVARLPLPAAFLHRDEFPCTDVPLPAVLLETGKDLDTLVSAEDFAAITRIDALEAAVLSALRARGIG
jgi:hypothetical protein